MSNHISIKVIDAIMGTGKSEWAIRKMIDNPEDGPYVVVVPLLTEVEKYAGLIPGAVGLIKGEGKLKRYKDALIAGETVVITHSLFQKFDDECFEYAREGGHSLFIDETVSLVSEAGITASDYKALKDTWLTEQPTGKPGMVEAVPVTEIGEYEGKHKWFLSMVKTGHIFILKGKVVLLIVPPERLKAFEEVTIMTYLFLGSDAIPFFELYEMPYEHLRLESLTPEGTPPSFMKWELTEHDGIYTGAEAKKLINVYEGKLNDIGVRRHKNAKWPFSFGWYQMVSSYDNKSSGKYGLEKIRKNLRSFFSKADRDDILWTCPKGLYRKLRDNHFDLVNDTSWLAVNTRGTNDYSKKHYVAICQNLYPRMPVQEFFKEQPQGLVINSDAHALSMMVQFIWRSAIRTGQEVFVYIPSERMRDLLNQWLNGEIQFSDNGEIEDILLKAA